jgi:hypothetical protein
MSNNEKLAIISSEQAYQISAWKAFSIVAGAVIVGIVGAAFAFLSTTNSDHFALISSNERIEALEATTVRRDVLVETLEPMKDSILRIENKLDRYIEEDK